MKSCLIALLLLVGYSLLGQSTKPKRFLAYIDTPTGFMFTWNHDQQAELFYAAKESKINLYHFGSFDKAPKKISYSSLPEIIESSMLSDFPKWNDSEEYLPVHWVYNDKGDPVWQPASTIACNSKLFTARKKNKKTIPTDTAYWMRTLPEISFQSIVLDFVTTVQHDTILQYIHYFHSAKKYCVSFKASEVVPLLNATNNAWYPNAANFASHVAGDLFLLDSRNRYKIFGELWPLLDTVKLKNKKPALDDYSLHCSVQMKAGKINGFILGGEHKSYGKVSLSKIQTIIDADRQEFYRMGDALARFRMFPLGKAFSIKEFKPLKTVDLISAAVRIEQLELVQEETFDFRDQDQDNKFIEDMTRLLQLVFEGVSESKVKVYKDASVRENYSANELIKFWAHNKIDEWISDTYYTVDETVTYGNDYYTSNDTERNYDRPDSNPQKWEKGKIAISQPESVKYIIFSIRTTFDSRGNMLERKYTTLQLGQLGYFRFDEIRDYVMSANSGLWKNIFKWMDDNGIYDLSPITLKAKK